MTNRQKTLAPAALFFGYLFFSALVSIATYMPHVLQPLGLSLNTIFIYGFLYILISAYWTVSSVVETEADIPTVGFARILFELFKFGIAFTFTGLATAIFALFASATGFERGFGEFLSFYAQLALNFLIGGVTLVGASLPAIQPLFKRKAEQCGGCEESEEKRGVY